MNNLHRELAPISAAAWAQIEEEASRTLKTYLAARRVVDVSGPKGFDSLPLALVIYDRSMLRIMESMRHSVTQWRSSSCAFPSS